MSMAKKIKSVLIERDMTIKDLSKKMGHSDTYQIGRASCRERV